MAEFREMVGALHATGLEVVLDQVFNHTAQSGQGEKSVLDRIVPGYYHRLSATGTIGLPAVHRSLRSVGPGTANHRRYSPGCGVGKL